MPDWKSYSGTETVYPVMSDPKHEGKSDDLMEAAIRVVDAAREDLLLANASENKALLRQVAISVVHGALLAERQREYPDDIWVDAKKTAAIVLSGETLADVSQASIDKAERHMLLVAGVIAKALLAEREAEHARCNATVKAAWGSNISLEAFEAALMQLPDSFRPHLPAPPSTEENLQHD